MNDIENFFKWMVDKRHVNGYNQKGCYVFTGACTTGDCMTADGVFYFTPQMYFGYLMDYLKENKEISLIKESELIEDVRVEKWRNQ